MDFPNPYGFSSMNIVPMKTFAQKNLEENLASSFYCHIVEMIVEFENALDTDHEVGARLVSFGQTLQFHIVDLKHRNPSLIVFVGMMDDGSRVELIQHVSQINFLLVAMKKQEEEEPPRRIGFKLQEE